MTTFIKIPFAESGDKVTTPATDPAGGVNWTQGYPSAYSKDPATDPSAKRIERENFNDILNKLSKAINEIQKSGVSTFITAADNGGSAYAYGKGAVVSINGVLYQSLVDANVTTPPSAGNWEVFGGATALGLGTAAKQNIGNTVGTNEIPSMAQWGRSNFGDAAGYLKTPAGILFQWGNFAAQNGVTLPLHLAYTNSAWQMSCQCDTTITAGNVSAGWVDYSNQTTTGATVLITRVLNGNQVAWERQIHWIAVGYSS